MGKHDYDIEDILLEAQMRKKQRQGSEGGKPVVPAAPLPAEMSRAPSVRGTLPVPAPFVRAEAPKPEAVPPARPDAPGPPAGSVGSGRCAEAPAAGRAGAG